MKTFTFSHFIKKHSYILLLFFYLGFYNNAFCQDTIKNNKDSIVTLLQNITQIKGISLEEIVTSKIKNSKINLENNRIVKSQNEIFNLINAEILKANKITKHGIDYKKFTSEIDLLLKWKKFAVEGITVNKDKIQTTRNLTTTYILLTELLKRTDNQLNNIKSNNQELSDILFRLDSLVANKDLYKIPTDSAAKNNYYKQFILINNDISETNFSLKNAIDSIQTLVIKGEVFKYNLDSDILKIDMMRKAETDSIFIKKVPVFENRSLNDKTFLDSFNYSIKKGYLILSFYIINHLTAIRLLFLSLIGIIIYLTILKNKFKKANLLDEFKYRIEILDNPIASSIIITITLFQLFIKSPPLIFSAILWFITSFAVIILISKTYSKEHLLPSIIYAVLTYLILFDNLILIQTTAETWFLIAIGVTATILGCYRIYNRNKIFDISPFWVILIMILFEVSGLFFLINGNFNIGKAAITIGIMTILISYLSLYTYQLIADIIKLSAYFTESDDAVILNTETRESHKIEKGFYILFLINWIILINRNTYSFEDIMDPIKLFLTEEQEIGSFKYTYEGIYTFFFVLILSTLISKIVYFLASDHKNIGSVEKSTSLGSWILLIRIGIICIGIVIAFATAGIPMDRLTVIIGALGIGIGFGLQGLVNNLVSGLIIAFEKPVNLDDIIEIGTQTGKMKSIGIRSSIVTTWDGADIVIPNGDLLSQHLTNWTMGSTKRRFEIKVGVAYGTDLKLAKTIIEKTLDQHPIILKNPLPNIWVTGFNDSSIDFIIKFWVPHFNYGNDVKSDLIMDINENFKSNDIVIPFPQRDLHIINKPNQNEDIKE
jgi:small-conductance mechanosensitive channel